MRNKKNNRRRAPLNRQSSQRRKVQFEAMEPRVLLSADPVITLGTASVVEISQHDKLAADGGVIVDLKINGQLTTLGGEAAGIHSLTITGSAGDDSFEFLNPLSVGVSIDGGDGTDTLTGPSDARTWLITGANAGSSSATAGGAAVQFLGVENITGGAGDDDFKLA